MIAAGNRSRSALPRVLFVSRARYRMELPSGERRRWDALARVCEPRVLAVAGPASNVATDARFRLWQLLPRLDGPLFYLFLPYRIARELRQFRPEIAVVQGVHEAVAFILARRLSGSEAKLVLDVQGDWRAATRLYGSRARRLLNPVNDRLGSFAVGHADAIRTLSTFTAGLVRELGREPAAIFPPYTDSLAFWERPVVPLPVRPRVLFVGVLELYKGVDILASAWRSVVRQIPGAVLHIVGDGSRRREVEQLLAELPQNVIWTRQLSPDGVAEAMDAATALCLPSRVEGLGRVAYEALARGRPVIGARAGGIPDVVGDGETGMLVEPEQPAQLAEALVRLLLDPTLAEELGSRGRASARIWLLTADEFADRYGRLFDTLRGDTGERAGG